MTKKPKLFLDFDGVLVDTVKAFCKVYSDRKMHHEDFKIPYPCLVTDWNLKSQCPLFTAEEVEGVFEDRSLFEYLQPFPNAKEVLLRLQDEYQLVIVTLGSYKNLAYKCAYIKKHFPFIKDFVGLSSANSEWVDKSIVNMDGDNGDFNFFIDDNAKNLFSQDSAMNLIRLCYGDKRTDWNKDWLDINGRWAKNWFEVEKKLSSRKKV